MLAEKIIDVLAQMNDYTAYKALQKAGYNPDDKAWNDIYNKYKDDEKNAYTKTLIHYLCESEVREQARKTTLKPSQKKRIKAIEKFLKDKSMDSRPVFQHYYEDGENIVYTNTHMLGVISKEDAQGINDNLNLKNLEGGNFPDWHKVVPELKDHHQTATISYGEVLATHKDNKANKRSYDIYIAHFNNGTIGGYNAEYLLHCFAVLGQDKITLARNEGESKIIRAVIITAENTSSYFVLTPVRLSDEYIKQNEQVASRRECRTMGACACEVCTKQNTCQWYKQVIKAGCEHFEQWENIYYYEIDFADDEDETKTSHELIAVNVPINNNADMLYYWPEIKRHTWSVWGHMTDFTQYDIDIEEDDAELATYIYLDEKVLDYLAEKSLQAGRD